MPKSPSVTRIGKKLSYPSNLYSITRKARNTKIPTLRRRKALYEAKDATINPYDISDYMSKQPHDNVSNVTFAIKRKRALVWLSTTRARCDEILTSLTSEGILQELSPLGQWSVNKGTSKGKVQHERFDLGINE